MPLTVVLCVPIISIYAMPLADMCIVWTHTAIPLDCVFPSPNITEKFEMPRTKLFSTRKIQLSAIEFVWNVKVFRASRKKFLTG